MATFSRDTTKGERRWRGTLQARLIGSHILAILLALALVLLMSSAYLRRYERRAAEERLAQLAVPLTAEVNVARLGERIAGGPGIRVDALDAQAEAMDLRLLVLEPDGTVRYDTDEAANLRDQTLSAYGPIARSLLLDAQSGRGLYYRFVEAGGNDPFAGHRLLISAGRTGVFEARRALMIVTDDRRYPLLGLFLPRLLIVTGASLVIASAFGYVLSRHIARPIQQLTVAADAMAAGQLEQQVAVSMKEPDEIGRLVASFNSMSRQVATTHRSQRELLANVAHELRTPLTSVQGYTQAIRDGVVEPGEELNNALRVVAREAERMSSLIGQLLDLARLESGQAPLRLQPVAVRALFDRVTAIFRPAAEEKSVDLTASTPEGLAVYVDENRLVQIVSNLVDNAIRHTGSGGLVALRAEPGAPLPGERAAVELVVHDTGEGIAPERLPRIFARFERGDLAPGWPHSGFGLGLSIVRELVELHGGKVEVESALGRGSTFRVTLPAA